jgi:DNA-directed RNA polymerase subunit RPC12/RpoP
MFDDFDQFIGFDLITGSDEAKCPHCGERVPISILIVDDEIECPRCGHKFNPSQK